MLKRTLYTRLFPKQARVDRYLAVIQRKIDRCRAALRNGPPGESSRLLKQHNFIGKSLLRAVDKRNCDV